MSALACLRKVSETGWIRGAIYFLAPAIAAFAPKWMPLILVVGAFHEAARFAEKKDRIPRSIFVPAFLFGALVLWALASALWSISPVETLVKAIAILGFGICGFVLVAGGANCSDSQRQIVELSIALGTVLLASQIAVEIIGEGAITRLLHSPTIGSEHSELARLKPGASVLAIFAWPAAIVLWRRLSRFAAAALIIVSVTVIFEVSAYSALIALAAGGFVFCCATNAMHAAARMLALGAAAIAVAAPLIVTTVAPGPWIKQLPDSVEVTVYHRFVIWDFSARAVAEKPITGWGLRTSRAIPGGTESADINRDLEYDPPRLDSEPSMMSLHPHNGFVQVWLELGLVGILLGVALIGPIPLYIERGAADKLRAAGQLAMFTAAFSIACLSYGLWQTWWMALLWLAAGQSVAACRLNCGVATALTR